jgi:uncharacterized protein (TIGR02145 family)
MFKWFRRLDITQFVMSVVSSIIANVITSGIVVSSILRITKVINDRQFILIIGIIILIIAIVVIIFNIKRKMATFTDFRDKQKYRTVKIGRQIWMAQNLNFAGESNNIGKCYDNDFEFGDIYGRLYDWETAKNICPKGWHLPTKEDWETLVKFVGGRNVAGNKLKAKEGWYNKGNGSDEFGFSALPGGLWHSNQKFIWIGSKGVWWSKTENNTGLIYSRGIDHNGDWMFQGEEYKTNLLSIRCVKD